MTEDLEPGLEPEMLLPGFEPDDLDGHTIDELSDYLDSGRQPHDPGIENSPGCHIALDALLRLRTASIGMLETEAESEPGRDQNWIHKVMTNISREAHAGRDIPISHPDPDIHLKVTEGSIRGLIRAVGGDVGGTIIGKVELHGDVTAPGEPIVINVAASAVWGPPLLALAELLREKIVESLAAHTDLNVTAVNITIQDIHTRRDATTEHS